MSNPFSEYLDWDDDSDPRGIRCELGVISIKFGKFRSYGDTADILHDGKTTGFIANLFNQRTSEGCVLRIIDAASKVVAVFHSQEECAEWYADWLRSGGENDDKGLLEYLVEEEKDFENGSEIDKYGDGK